MLLPSSLDDQRMTLYRKVWTLMTLSQKVTQKSTTLNVISYLIYSMYKSDVIKKIYVAVNPK